MEYEMLCEKTEPPFYSIHQ